MLRRGDTEFGGDEGMIRSLQQARRIQLRRVAAGKRGYAKAVLRYLRRAHAGDYDRAKATLPEPLPSRPRRRQPAGVTGSNGVSAKTRHVYVGTPAASGELIWEARTIH
jgi:hypothetical protein